MGGFVVFSARLLNRTAQLCPSLKSLGVIQGWSDFCQSENTPPRLRGRPAPSRLPTPALPLAATDAGLGSKRGIPRSDWLQEPPVFAGG